MQKLFVKTNDFLMCEISPLYYYEYTVSTCSYSEVPGSWIMPAPKRHSMFSNLFITQNQIL